MSTPYSCHMCCTCSTPCRGFFFSFPYLKSFFQSVSVKSATRTTRFHSDEWTHTRGVTRGRPLHKKKKTTKKRTLRKIAEGRFASIFAAEWFILEQKRKNIKFHKKFHLLTCVKWIDLPNTTSKTIMQVDMLQISTAKRLRSWRV